MNMVSLQPMTREMCHEFYKGFKNDPAIFMDMSQFVEYEYSTEKVDRYFDENCIPSRRLFAIMVGDQIVGECKLKYIDLDKRECSMGIHLLDDTVKGKGYGTQAERLLLQYAFEELGMVAVNADAVLKNTRSQYVLEKVGFYFVREDETFKYYRCERNDSMHTDMELRNQIILDLMGKTVHVVVDRPIGYQHGDITYPINYGYIPGIIAGDGEEQDAYILGVTEPLSSFAGQVVAAVRRKNDCEDKLVVAPAGKVYHQGEIAEAVHFQEQYFISTVDSLLRKSCGVIPYRWNGKEKEYLIVLQTNDCWSFPKGHMEAGETESQTALRELYEETGLTAALDEDSRVLSEYDIPPFTKKQVVLFLGNVLGEVTPQETEVVRYLWVKKEELKDYLHPDTYDACKLLLP